MTTPDSELLREFARNRSEKIFATLVSRHVDLVYSAALRQVRSPQLAEDVAQTVFLDLARNADKLAPDTILTAWLYRVTRRAAIDVVRSESRRQLREQIAVELSAMNSPDTHWKEIEPLLDEAMDALDETDRASILLRYFENKTLREVGERLGTSDDAAQKRVSRAVERLREFFSKRGVTIGASGLAVAISGNAVQAAPIGFALTISSALIGTTLASATTATAIKTVAMTTLQKSLITAVIVAAVGAGIYQTREVSNLREQVESLKQQQQSAPADQLQQLTSERDYALRQLADLREENERLNRNSAELIRLRGAVGKLRESEKELAQLKSEEKADQLKAARVHQLKQKLEEMPERKIPELKLLTMQDWVDAANTEFKNDSDFRKAFKNLRITAKAKFMGEMERALTEYSASHQGQFPIDLSELKTYLGPDIDEAMLQRYEILYTKKTNDITSGETVVAEKAPVDDKYDTRFVIGRTNSNIFGLNAYLPDTEVIDVEHR
jgi:RNA polymerase sigma factor (sigma-70 family)